MTQTYENIQYVADELERLAKLTRKWGEDGTLTTDADVARHTEWLVEVIEGEVARKAQWGA